jgi:hypothetical protein
MHWIPFPAAVLDLSASASMDSWLRQFHPSISLVDDFDVDWKPGFKPQHLPCVCARILLYPGALPRLPSHFFPHETPSQEIVKFKLQHKRRMLIPSYRHRNIRQASDTHQADIDSVDSQPQGTTLRILPGVLVEDLHVVQHATEAT